ncbi:hypothetical protein Tco_0995378, partial [Tanacetum coccineum]
IDIKEPFPGARLLPLRSSFTVTIVVFGAIKSQGSSAGLSVSCESAEPGNPRPMQISRSWWYHTYKGIFQFLKHLHSSMKLKGNLRKDEEQGWNDSRVLGNVWRKRWTERINGICNLKENTKRKPYEGYKLAIEKDGEKHQDT